MRILGNHCPKWEFKLSLISKSLVLYGQFSYPNPKGETKEYSESCSIPAMLYQTTWEFIFHRPVKDETVFWKKEEAICFCEGQMAGYVTIYYVVIYRSACPTLSSIQLLIIWLFFIAAIHLISMACSNIITVFLKLQTNSKCLNSTTRKNPQQYVLLLEFYLSENL